MALLQSQIRLDSCKMPIGRLALPGILRAEIGAPGKAVHGATTFTSLPGTTTTFLISLPPVHSCSLG